MKSDHVLRSRFWSAIVTAAAFTWAWETRATSLTWNLAGSGTWDTTTANWAPGPTVFANGADSVTFANTAGGTITVSSGMNPTATSVSAASGNYTFGGAPIAGGTFTKSGAGNVYLNNGQNAFSSATLSGGWVYFYANNQLGTGTTTINAAMNLNAGGAAGYATVLDNPVDWAAGNYINFNYCNTTFNGPVKLGGQCQVAGGGTGAIVFNGVVSNYGATNGAIYMNGPPAYLKNDNNTYNGQTYIQGGAIYFTSVAPINGGNSALGNYTTATAGNSDIYLGSGGGVCTYGYIGTLPAWHSTDRKLKFNTNGPEAGKYTAIDASGVGPLQLTATTLTYTSVNGRWLTFTGTNTGNNLLGAAITEGGTGTALNVTNVEKTNGGKWIFTGSSTFKGALSISKSSYAGGSYAWANYLSGGELVFRDNGATTLTSGVTVDRGTLTLDNTGIANLADRVNNAAPVTLTTSTLRLLGNTGANSSESLGALSIGGGSVVSVANGTSGATSATLTFASMTRLANGSANFVGTNGTLGAGGNNPGIVLTGATNDATGILGTWATVNGADWASIGANGVQAYTGYTALRTGAAGPEPDTYNSNLGGSQTQVASVTTNSLKIAPSGAGQSLALGVNNLTLTGGGLLLTGNDFSISGAGTLAAAGGVALTVGADSGRTLTLSNVVGGNTGLNKIGAGTLVLGNSGNSYTSGTNVYAGTLEGTADTVKGAVSVDTGATVAYNQAAVGILANVVSGTGTLLKKGTDTLRITAANSYTGGTTLTAGTLEFVSGAMTGSGPFGAGPISMATGTKLFHSDMGGWVTLSNPIAIANGASVEVATNGPNSAWVSYGGTISGGTLANPVTLVLRGVASGANSVVNLTGVTNTFTGHVEIRDATYININGPANLGAATNDVYIVGRTGWLTNIGLQLAAGTYTVPQSIKMTGYSLFNCGGTTTFTGNLTDAGANDSIAFFMGGGEAILQGTNSPKTWYFYNSPTTLTVSTQANLGTAPIQSGYTSADWRVRFAGAGSNTFTNDIGGFDGNSTNKTMSLDVLQSGATVLLTGTITGVVNKNNIAKTGVGRMDWNGAVSNTGTTTVSAGTLNVNVTTAVNQGSYTVASGAALGGTGNIRLAAGASVTNNGTITPGTSPGTLTVTGGNVVFASGSTLREEIGGLGAGQFDALTVTGGTLNLSATGDILDITTLAPYYSNIGDSVRFLNAAATTGTFDILRWNGWTTNSVYTVSYDAGGATLQFLVSIPEPASVLLLAGAALLVGRRRRV